MNLTESQQAKAKENAIFSLEFKLKSKKEESEAKALASGNGTSFEAETGEIVDNGHPPTPLNFSLENARITNLYCNTNRTHEGISKEELSTCIDKYYRNTVQKAEAKKEIDKIWRETDTFYDENGNRGDGYITIEEI